MQTTPREIEDELKELGLTPMQFSQIHEADNMKNRTLSPKLQRQLPRHQIKSLVVKVEAQRKKLKRKQFCRCF